MGTLLSTLLQADEVVGGLAGRRAPHPLCPHSFLHVSRQEINLEETSQLPG